MIGNNKISANQITKQLGITHRTAQRDIGKLKKQNKLKRIGTEKLPQEMIEKY